MAFIYIQCQFRPLARIEQRIAAEREAQRKLAVANEMLAWR